MNLNLYCDWAIKSVARRGLFRTGKIMGSVILDLVFDVWYGTETLGWVWVEDLGANSEHDANAVGYRPSKVLPLRALIKRLKLPRDLTFVDLGSGKGRVLLLAAKMGFQKIVGVEFSPKLCAIAQTNVEKFTGQLGLPTEIRVIQADAALFTITPDQCIFYAFNPFDGVVLGELMGSLRDSLTYFPREVWFIYNTPLHTDVIERSGLFSLVQDCEIGGTEFKIYRN
jgi:SAM-dependent methyltransferase